MIEQLSAGSINWRSSIPYRISKRLAPTVDGLKEARWGTKNVQYRGKHVAVLNGSVVGNSLTTHCSSEIDLSRRHSMFIPNDWS